LKFLQRYRIPYTGLKNGHHKFDFEVDNRFFDEFDYSIVKEGKLAVSVDLERQENMMIVNFDINGYIFLNCDLCLSDFPFDVHIQERIIIKFQEDKEINNTTEEILVLSKNEHQLDIAPLLYEYINLAVPFHIRCTSPGNMENCDPDMIFRLQSLVNNADNKVVDDPRWDILKKIKNN